MPMLGRGGWRCIHLVCSLLRLVSGEGGIILTDGFDCLPPWLGSGGHGRMGGRAGCVVGASRL